ncbi:MAG: hypothetical protein HKN90_06430 [Flavobacteriaceae bacterium]|nr:hypothetical protein [Flavobacteriaceae bacterium]
MMRKPFQILILFASLLIFEKAFSQEKYGDNPEMCKEKLSEFFEYAKTEDYDYAYQPWLWVFENCPKASKNIYKYGLKIIEDRYQKSSGEQKTIEGELLNTIYEKRIQYFPDNLGKVYSDWALSLEERNADEETVFEKLELAFKTDPSQMSIKNLAQYFQIITDKNKDTNLQLVFDTYDDAMDAVNSKIDYHSKELEKEPDDESTSANNHRINLRGLGQIENLLDNILSDIASCDKLIPLYTKNLDTYKTNGKWLRRAASRLNEKDCTDNDIYPKLVEAYVNVEPSPEAYIFLASVLQKQGKDTDVIQNINKAIELENDPYKKATYLYRLARNVKNRSKSQSRAYANRALKYRPNMGKAYLLIANLYALSANACGTDEFSKKMTFVAAANKAIQAKNVDPSITSLANKYIANYEASGPSKTLVFTKGLKSGDPYTVQCWIGETVKIP